MSLSEKIEVNEAKLASLLKKKENIEIEIRRLNNKILNQKIALAAESSSRKVSVDE